MSLRSAPARTTTRALPVAGLAAALLLTGCGAGQKAQVYQERTVADATNTSVGTIAVRDLAIQAPARGLVLRQGTNATMSVTLINEGGDDDVLQSASTDAATGVRVVGPTSSLPVPRLSTASSDYSLELVGLTRDLPTGTYINLTLSFQRNGVKSMLVPVETTPDGAPRPSGEYEVPETDSAGSPLPTQPALP